VSRIENGKQLPSRTDIDAWAALSSATIAETRALRVLLDRSQTQQRAWRRRMRKGLAEIQSDYNTLVNQATSIAHFETAVVPGLIQTAEYARRIMSEMAELQGITTRDDDAAVTARLARSAYLDDLDKNFRFLLAEPVLRWQLASREVMVEQLSATLQAADRPNVEVRILPLGRPLATTPQLSFQLYDGPAIGPTAIVDTVSTELTYHDDLATAYTVVFGRLWDEAAAGDDARRLIDGAIGDLRG
jgi:hypothetical protein